MPKYTKQPTQQELDAIRTKFYNKLKYKKRGFWETLYEFIYRKL